VLPADTRFIMRSITAVLLLVASIAGAADAAEKNKRPATPRATPPAAAKGAAVSPRDAALQHLFAERGSAATMQAAIERARKQGISDQVVLEARFLFLVDRHDDDAIAALLPEVVKLRESFSLDDSEIFATKEDWLAVNEYIEAVAALNKGDKDAFKKHITEAFWLSPQQGAAFAPHIDRLRLEDAMRSIKIDFTAEFTTITSAEPQSLKNFIGGKPALLLHFWSPWSNESTASMPDFIRTAKVLTPNKIAVVSILAGDAAGMLADARAAFKSLGEKAPGAWLIDRKPHSLKRELRVLSLPTMVLIAADGTILFNGHPAADDLWQALRKINPMIRRPAIADDSNNH
jgi:hypothetical protein